MVFMAETRPSFKIGEKARVGMLYVGNRKELVVGSPDGQHPSIRNQPRPAVSPGAESLSSPDVEVDGAVGIIRCGSVSLTDHGETISDEVQMKAILEALRSPGSSEGTPPPADAMRHEFCDSSVEPLLNSERHATSPVVSLSSPIATPAPTTPLTEVALQRRDGREETAMADIAFATCTPVADTADPTDTPVVVFLDKVHKPHHLPN